MRKLVLITALLLASASAHAGDSRGLVLAANDTPAATDTVAPAAAAAPAVTDTSDPIYEHTPSPALGNHEKVPNARRAKARQRSMAPVISQEAPS